MQNTETVLFTVTQCHGNANTSGNFIMNKWVLSIIASHPSLLCPANNWRKKVRTEEICRAAYIATIGKFILRTKIREGHVHFQIQQQTSKWEREGKKHDQPLPDRNVARRCWWPALPWPSPRSPPLIRSRWGCPGGPRWPWRRHWGRQGWSGRGWPSNSGNRCSACRSPSAWAAAGEPSALTPALSCSPSWRSLQSRGKKRTKWVWLDFQCKAFSGSLTSHKTKHSSEGSSCLMPVVTGNIPVDSGLARTILIKITCKSK